MPTRQETELERRRRQLEVIGRKLERATRAGDDDAAKLHRDSYTATQEDITRLEQETPSDQTGRRRRRGE